ncbi:unnamed protein product [Protopolystoma xenopodis]|uniref:Uncharacterized protein n=1 Tax=Protopolystoma xenopodis TaxID=117903 RepID=A0A3S5A8T3_9PLAT|nr:unnamed protein product [Protopolystoma xenopodis]
MCSQTNEGAAIAHSGLGVCKRRHQLRRRRDRSRRRQQRQLQQQQKRHWRPGHWLFGVNVSQMQVIVLDIQLPSIPSNRSPIDNGK